MHIFMNHPGWEPSAPVAHTMTISSKAVRRSGAGLAAHPSAAV
ncbi:MAG: hypothetical protein QF903_11795 [Planctomycetota bacterium]|nr:hypothetical protein [Planctomycetota bacterium]MDP6990143.1 hypothetical protein [Planctomycetota bacterium]